MKQRWVLAAYQQRSQSGVAVWNIRPPDANEAQADLVGCAGIRTAPTRAPAKGRRNSAVSDRGRRPANIDGRRAPGGHGGEGRRIKHRSRGRVDRRQPNGGKGGQSGEGAMLSRSSPRVGSSVRGDSYTEEGKESTTKLVPEN